MLEESTKCRLSNQDYAVARQSCARVRKSNYASEPRQ
jgi:hypothetical protein